jgi:hypothetical protein
MPAMKNTSFSRAMNALAHPLSIGAILLLLLNDHVLKQVYPSWWTGKLSDFAGLAFAPLVLAALLAWLIPPQLKNRDQIVGGLSLALVGLIFALAKTSPAFHAGMVRVLGVILGGPVDPKLDPTDLIALPALWVGWYVWKHPIKLPSLHTRGWVILALATLATVATEQPSPNYGIVCLSEQDSNLYTFAAYPTDNGVTYASMSSSVFVSGDGGLSWHDIGIRYAPPQTECALHTQAWQMTDPADARVQYRFTPSTAIDRSADSGLTWRREMTLVVGEARITHHKGRVMEFVFGPLNALAHRSTGNVVVAMGHEGVLVRTPDAQWHWAPVGPFQRLQLDSPNMIQFLLNNEFGLALILMGLILGTLARCVHRIRWGNFWLVAGWGCWGLAILLFLGLGTDLAGRDLAVPAFWVAGLSVLVVLMAIPLAALIAIPWGLYEAAELYRLNPRALLVATLTAVIGAALFILPYVLWAVEAILRYAVATGFAVLLAVSVMVAGVRYMRRLGQLVPVTVDTAQPTSLTPARAGWIFWFLWLLANALGGVMGFAGAWRFFDAQRMLNAVEWIAIEASMAWLQWVILRQYVKRAHGWMLATLAGQFTMWICKLVAVAWLADIPPEFLQNQVAIQMVIVYAIVNGSVIGLLQWFVLRSQVKRAHIWILATIMASVIAGVAWNVPSATAFSEPLQSGLMAQATLSGAIWGAITGGVLVWLLRHSAQE